MAVSGWFWLFLVLNWIMLAVMMREALLLRRVRLELEAMERERRIWAVWNALPDDQPSPVRTIAARLGLEPDAVAFVVYGHGQFGSWSEEDEPPL